MTRIRANDIFLIAINFSIKREFIRQFIRRNKRGWLGLP